MKLKCAIVDDEPLAIELLVSYVNKIPFMELTGKYANAVEAMKGLTETPVDVLFLDIQMPDLNGLELSKMIPETTRIVFTTAFEQYALEGFRINALDYLLKPISYSEFLEACNREERIQTAADRPRQHQVYRRPQGLCENLYRRVAAPHTFAHEHESHGADASHLTFHQGAPILHCAEK